MKAHYKINNSLSFELEGTPKNIFRQMVNLRETFGNRGCKLCGGETKRIVRLASKGARTFEYFELECMKCGGRFTFGQHQNEEETLYPKIKDEDGKPIGDNGWYKYKND